MQPFIMMILMFVIMYFVLIRPQRLRQKQLEARIAKIKIGDKIRTTAGIHGLVTNVKERTIMVKVDNNVKIEFDKPAVADIFPKESGDDEGDDEAESEAASDAKSS